MSQTRKRGDRYTHPKTGIEYVFDGTKAVLLDSPEGRRIIEESDAPVTRDRGDGEGQSGLAGFARTAAQGATFGFSDELAGLVARLPGGKTSEEATAAARQNLAQYRKDHPGMAIGAELAGGLIPSLFIPGGAARLAPTLGRGLRSARAGQRALAAGGLGAAEGAIYGAGSADEGRAGAAAMGGLLGGALGSAAGTFLPGPTGALGGGRAPGKAPSRGTQALEVLDVARGGPQRTPARIPGRSQAPSAVPIPPDIPVTPIRQQTPVAQPGLMGRIGQAASGAGEAVSGALEGLLPVKALRSQTERALRPVTRAGSARLAQLDDALKTASGAFQKLDDRFPSSWVDKARPGMTKPRLDTINREVVGVVQEIGRHRDSGAALKQVFGKFNDATSLDDLLRAVKHKNGKWKSPGSVERLSHRQVKALWQNLRNMSGDVAQADVFFRQLDKAYRKLYGKKATDLATKGYKAAIQDLDATRMGRSDSWKNLAGRKMGRPELFGRGVLGTEDGLRTAIKEISEHGGVGDTQRVLGNFLEGLFDTEVRQGLLTTPDETLKKLVGNEDWLRMFFAPGRRGDRAFASAWKEIQAAAAQAAKKGKKSLFTLPRLLAGGAGGVGGYLAWDLIN